MRRKLFGTRRRAVVVVAVLALVLSSTALAAWVLFTGASGSAQGTFATQTTTDAVTIATGSPGSFLCSPGGNCSLKVNATNKAGVDEQLTGGTATFTSTPAECASHLSLNPAAFPILVPAAADNSSVTLPVLIKVDATLPPTCSGGTFTATMTLTTNP